MNELAKTSESSDPVYREFDNYLLIAHYLAAHSACRAVPQLNSIATKLSVALLRYTDVIPADRAYYRAGDHCRVRERGGSGRTEEGGEREGRWRGRILKTENVPEIVKTVIILLFSSCSC